MNFNTLLIGVLLSILWQQPFNFGGGEKICAGDMLTFGSRSVKFIEVVSDSRCPSNSSVTCIWAGEAKVKLEFYQNGKSVGERVVNGNKFPLSSIYSGDNKGFLNFSLYPYPDLEKINPSEYTLELALSEEALED